MENQEYNQLVQEIAYQALLEQYNSDISENKAAIIKMVAKGVGAGLKYIQNHDKNVEAYRRRAEEIERTENPEEKARLEKMQQNARLHKGINDDSKTSTEHVVNAIGKGVDAVKKGVNTLKDKVQTARQNAQAQPA
jgi:Sec-independent protein translocase protein TatA